MANRSIYAYETNIFSVTNDGNKAEIRWNQDFAEKLFQHIISLDEKDRVLVKKDEWFFDLASITIDKRKNDPTHKDCIYGWFDSIKIGFRTDLKQLSTMGIRENPKAKDESEIHRTYFYLRLKDGFFLLDNYQENIITVRRIEQYFKEKAPQIFNMYRVHFITFVNILSNRFLEDIEKYDAIRVARVRLKVTPDKEYNTDDAIGSLQNESRSIYANYIDLAIGKKNARKSGLSANLLKEFLQKILSRNDQVISGTIEGSRSDGGPSTIRLKGIEEKHRDDFPVDAQGEVLHERMFGYMIELGNNHF